MTDVASSLTRTVARQYDLFQTSLELLQKDRKFLNYGYTVSGTETVEARQQRLCLEVFQAAEIGKDDVLVDVGFGFGSGEQDFLLSTACEFRRLMASTSPNDRFATPTSGRYAKTWRTSFRSAWERPSVFPVSRDHRWTEFWRSSARSTSIGRASTSARRRS
jgi:hypothetical protein